MASLSRVYYCRRHLAAAEGKLSAAKWLLDQGCTPNPVDRFFRTPLEVCGCPSLPSAYLQLSEYTDRAGQAQAQPRPYMHPCSQTLRHRPLHVLRLWHQQQVLLLLLFITDIQT